MRASAKRRTPFAKDLRRNASQWGLALSETIAFEFRRRYGLPPTDPRYLDATEAEIIVDVWAHRHMDDPKLRERLETEDFDEELARMEAEAAAEELPPSAPGPDDFEPVVADTYEA